MSGAGIYYVCDYCNKTVKSFSNETIKWDWFTGYNKGTVHICAQCLETKGKKYRADRMEAHKRALINAN